MGMLSQRGGLPEIVGSLTTRRFCLVSRSGTSSSGSFPRLAPPLGFEILVGSALAHPTSACHDECHWVVVGQPASACASSRASLDLPTVRMRLVIRR